MFEQSEKKLKTWAVIQGVFFSIVAIILCLLVYSSIEGIAGILMGLIVAIIVWFLSMLSAWTLYSFADLVEYTKANNEILAAMNSTLNLLVDDAHDDQNNESAE